MPRDDLSIDFVKRMPLGEALDPATILDDFINRTQNLPEEVRFLQDEIADRDRQTNDCVKLIEERDGRIQKWIRANGSHERNPKEEGYRVAIREAYDRADKLSLEKIALSQKLQVLMDKHLRVLDAQIKQLYDRNEPGFDNPDEVPSLVRPSAANNTAPSARTVNAASNPITAALISNLNTATSPSAARAANPQVRQAQTQQSHPTHAASAPATPAATIILNRQAREGSAGPASKRGPRVNSGLGNLPATSSGLARHSSLGPGTPKPLNPAASQRAGSAGPRASTKNAGTGPSRKAGTPSASGGIRKKGATGSGITKSNLSRVKRPAKNSPSSTADSELSEADSASESAASSRRGTPARGSSQKPDGSSQPSAAGSQSGPGGGGSQHPLATKREHHMAEVRHHSNDSDDAMDGDDDEAGDDRKYCLCQKVSFGDMVACDNEACPYEWFHWDCVGLKAEPSGTWFCPVCRKTNKGTSTPNASAGANGAAAAGGAGGAPNGSSEAAATAGAAGTKKGK